MSHGKRKPECPKIKQVHVPGLMRFELFQSWTDAQWNLHPVINNKGQNNSDHSTERSNRRQTMMTYTKANAFTVMLLFAASEDRVLCISLQTKERGKKSAIKLSLSFRGRRE
ncbi:hypothetical protein Ancab_033120 [Ancistrocladus abbreviatus]